MKKMFIAVLCCVLLLNGFSQQGESKKLQQVKVNDWNNNVSFFIGEEAWKQAGDTLRKQVGDEGLQKIMFYTKHENMPPALLLWHPVKQPKKIPLEEYEKRLSTLKVYQVATYYMFYKERRFDYVVLSVPYQELSWDKTATWDTVYFVVRAGAVEPVH